MLIRSLLLSTIKSTPVLLKSIHSDSDDASEETRIRAEVLMPGRNNVALEEIVMRLSTEDDVSNISWTVVESSME